MAILKKGARRISVDGEQYLWRIRKKPRYDQALALSGLIVAVQHEGVEVDIQREIVMVGRWGQVCS